MHNGHNKLVDQINVNAPLGRTVLFICLSRFFSVFSTLSAVSSFHRRRFRAQGKPRPNSRQAASSSGGGRSSRRAQRPGWSKGSAQRPSAGRGSTRDASSAPALTPFR